MTDSELIKSFIDQYQLEVDGVEFWTPYWREGEGLPATDHAQSGKGAFKGKGTPSQIMNHLLHNSPSKPLSTPEDYRRYMREELHLGVECSGFIYYALDQVLHAKKSLRLQDHLYKSRNDLLEDFDRFGSAHKPEITREFLQDLPEKVSLTSIQEFWGNEPVKLAGVLVLTGDHSSDTVESTSNLAVGDQIVMTGKDDGVDHSLLVVSVDEQITYAHSGGTHGRKGYFGGVEYGEIKIIDPDKPIDDQEWLENGQLILDTHKNFSLRRLKVLDG